MRISESFEILKQNLESIETVKVFGKIVAVKGVTLECRGLQQYLSIGQKCKILKDSDIHSDILAEVISLKDDVAVLLPFGDIDGIAIGNNVILDNKANNIYPDVSWLGRVINAFAEPIDDKGAIKNGKIHYNIKNKAPNPQKRKMVGEKIDLGIKAIDCFVPCCVGQRMGVFAGSGVGKSVMISMLARYAKTDIKIIGLIGERGREVQEFIQEYLGEDGLKQSVIIVATGDEPALIRRRAAYLTITVAEFFRDQGYEVLCVIDSVTRLAMAQREIGLAAGEPPTTKGYTPSVFSELPKLLERAGPGIEKTSITGLFTVLVDGDDQNEPITDSVRSILDGHIVLDRSIAERGRYPAVDVLKSVSRTLPRCNSDIENKILQNAKSLLSIYSDMSEMIRLGAYKKGADEMIDKSIKFFPLLEEFLSQGPYEHKSMNDSIEELSTILEKINKS